MFPVQTIENKRDGRSLNAEELRAFIDGYARGTVSDAQMAALAMAVMFRGMDFDEITVLTEAMMHSGHCLDPEIFRRPTADKHSTGGVGDKVSIVLAPLAAAAGLAVPMISGRGLGPTGGTLDKLESIPGLQTALPLRRLGAIVNRVGCAVAGATRSLAPADRKLYALRDVTGTVPSLALIVSSIMSKKLAGGARSLVLDVKTGRGALMADRDRAVELARALLAVGRRMGRRMSALISAMDQPLGRAIGNALEVREALETLRGGGPAPLWELCLAQGTEMLVLSGLCPRRADAARRIEQCLRGGHGLETLARMIEAQGGDATIVEHPERLPTAPCIHDLPAPRSGFVHDVDAARLGRLAMELGGGRRQPGDRIDSRVGFDALRMAGETVREGESLGRVHAATNSAAATARRAAIDAFTLTEGPPPRADWILETLSEPGGGNG